MKTQIHYIKSLLFFAVAASSCHTTDPINLVSVQAYDSYRKDVIDGKKVPSQAVIYNESVNITDADIMSFAVALSQQFLVLSERHKQKREYSDLGGKFLDGFIAAGTNSLGAGAIKIAPNKLGVLSLVNVADLQSIFKSDIKSKNYAVAAYTINKSITKYYRKCKRPSTCELSDDALTLLDGLNGTIKLLDATASGEWPDANATNAVNRATGEDGKGKGDDDDE